MKDIIVPDSTYQVDTWVQEERTPGLIRRRTVVAGPWEEERTDCFCCSCHESDYYGGHDPFCRNHGYAGKRPCKKHDMPGFPDEYGYMPASVQVRIAQNEAAHSRWRKT